MSGKIRSIITFFVFTFFILAVSSAMAQKQVPKKMPTLGCCTCLGGTNTLNLSTVPANPWTVNGNPVAVTSPINGAWNLPTGPANWVSLNTGGSMGGIASGPHYYRLQFAVPNCTIDQKVFLNGTYGADDAVDVFLDIPLISQCGGGGWCFNIWNTPPPLVNVPVSPGLHTLLLVVNNGSLGPSGIFVNAKLTGTCTKQIIKP